MRLVLGLEFVRVKKLINIISMRQLKIAMERAVSKLNPKPQHLLLDAMSLPRLDIPQTSIIKGDSKKCFDSSSQYYCQSNT